jgi:hypothetical protein
MNTKFKFLLISILFLNLSNTFSFNCDYITQTDTNKPKEFYLGRPFSDNLYHIEFGVTDSAQITLNIYNINNYTIKESIRCIVAGGKYKFDWNKFYFTPNTPSGVYYVKIDASPINDRSKIFSKTKRVLWIK